MTIFFPAGLNVGGTFLGQSTEQNLEQNAEQLTDFVSGDWAPAFVGASREEPEIAFNSTDITGVLDLMSTESLLRSAGAATINLLFRKGVNLSMRAAHTDLAHHVYSLISNAMWYWESISADQRNAARIETSLVTTRNGSNKPVTQLPDQAIDAPPNTMKLWTLGPVVINTVTLDRVKSWNWKNNCDILKDDANGNESPDVAIMRRVRPVITVETSDLSALAAFADGVAVTGLTVYLRRRQDNLINYSDASTVHMKLTAGAGSARFQRVGSDPASGRLAIQLAKDSNGDLFTYTKNVAIT